MLWKSMSLTNSLSLASIFFTATLVHSTICTRVHAHVQSVSMCQHIHNIMIIIHVHDMQKIIISIKFTLHYTVDGLRMNESFLIRVQIFAIHACNRISPNSLYYSTVYV